MEYLHKNLIEDKNRLFEMVYSITTEKNFHNKFFAGTFKDVELFEMMEKIDDFVNIYPKTAHLYLSDLKDGYEVILKHLHSFNPAINFNEDEKKQKIHVEYQTILFHLDRTVRKLISHIELFLKLKPQLVTPIFNPQFIDDIYSQLNQYFEPKEAFLRFLKGDELNEFVNFRGSQAQLAGIFRDFKKCQWISLGTHEQTFNFIKAKFKCNGKAIESDMILRYLKGDSSISSKNLISFEI